METDQPKSTPDAKSADEAAARDLLRSAFEKTYRWPKEFKGFQADLTCEEGGRTARGNVLIKSAREVTVRLDQEDLQKWAEGQITMMAVHRTHRTFDESDGRYTLTLGGDDHHPMGRLLNIHGDGINSRYRIKDNRVTQINRDMERVRFTINVDDTLTTADRRALTIRHTVFYFSPGDGSLRQVETFSDAHAVVNGIYLPGIRRVNFNDGGQVLTRRLEFDRHKLP